MARPSARVDVHHPRPRVDRGTVLMAVGEMLRQQVDLDTILGQVIDAVTEAMSADRGTFYLVDRARGEIFSKAGHYPEIGEIRLKIGQGIAGHVARTGQSVNLGDPAGDPRFLGDIDHVTGYATRSILCAPVKDRAGELLGVIQLLNKQDPSVRSTKSTKSPRAGKQTRAARRPTRTQATPDDPDARARVDAGFDEDDEALLRALASQVAMVVESTSLYGQMRAPATHPLNYRFNGIVGHSPAMRRVYDLVTKAAETDATVLVTGETGTGKGLLARAIHFNGPRRAGPFVAVDCAALPASLIENELFGHERGAFTGADRRYVGKFEAADGGTVFLDEIGEIPLALQGKLLRVIQERCFERVGGSRTVDVDVRIVAATHRDLEDMVARQRFREDLYYRLRVISLKMPPLRERGSADLEQLAYHFLGLYAARHQKPVRAITPAALQRLAAHRWPGNIRELENCIESAVVLNDKATLAAEDLPLPTPRPSAPGGAGADGGDAAGGTAPADLAALRWTDMERLYISAVLRAHGGNRSAAARSMGIGRTTLLRKIKSLHIRE